MKRLLIGLTIGTLALTSSMAQPPVPGQKTQHDNADWEFVPLTGSHLKQMVKKRNIITIGSHGDNVLTIDQREMERNGNAPIADQLSRYPGVSISHH
jgi:hypothetical protein